MIQRIVIDNFQSLHHVDLELAPLTVIVGPSSSGKSAFIRSLRALVGNRRGTDFITHGERVASISAHLAQGIVTLTRSTQTAPNSYVVIPADPHHPLHPKAEFTKLGGETPADVSDFLGIPTEHIALSIASQFDKPYLLDAPGTEVARTLASLTNAHIILGASRESNRQKLANAQTLKTRSADLEAIRARVPEFQALQAQRASLASAEERITRARLIASRITSIKTHIETIQIAEDRIPALTSALAALPDVSALHQRIDALSALNQRAGRLRRLLLDHQSAADDISRARLILDQTPSLASIDAAAQRLADARNALAAYQRAIGAVQEAQRGAQSARDALASADVARNEAREALRTVMGEVASGFDAYFREHGTTLVYGADMPESISIEEASRLAARYVATLES